MKLHAFKRFSNKRPDTDVRSAQYGLTLVELLVALVISLLIALAAISALTATQRGFNTVDASSQLRDNGRFAADLLQRLGVQSGFKDRIYAGTNPTLNLVGVQTNPAPNVMGFNNALFSNSQNTATSRTGSVIGFGSDVLILRFQTSETTPGSGLADGSMIDCSGNRLADAPLDRNDRIISIIHVAISLGEPSLMCSVLNPTTGLFSTQPIIQGVENFQVLYGTDGVTAGVAPPTLPASAAAISDSVPDRYLRADQLTVAGDAVGTNANWRRVRSLRVGLVLRGPLNSQQERVVQTFYPLGAARSSGSAATGSALSNNTDDPGTVFAPAADGRLRQVVTLTVHFRNDQGL